MEGLPYFFVVVPPLFYEMIIGCDGHKLKNN